MLYARAPQKLVGADTENLGKRVQLDIRDRTALSFQKGERGNAQVYAAKLQLRKKLYLLPWTTPRTCWRSSRRGSWTL